MDAREEYKRACRAGRTAIREARKRYDRGRVFRFSIVLCLPGGKLTVEARQFVTWGFVGPVVFCEGRLARAVVEALRGNGRDAFEVVTTG